MLISKEYKKIDWILFFILFFRAIGIDERVYFVISILFFTVLILKNKFILYIPKVNGFVFYILFVLYATFLGLYGGNGLRNVVRDLFYIVPTILWILISYSIGALNYKRKDIFKTIFLYGSLVSLKCIVTFILHPSFDLTYIRNLFGENVYDIGFILPVMIAYVMFYNYIAFSRLVDKIIILLMAAQCIFSFGRMAIIEPLIGLAVIVLLLAKYRPNKRIYRYIFGIIIALIIILVIFFYFMPSMLVRPFLDKFQNIFSEINANHTYNSYDDAINNWRGYEINSVLNQWINSDIIHKIFGFGLGKGIHIRYVPSEFYYVSNNEIPLLHNGFLTLLPKGGLLGVASLISMFLGGIKCGINMLKFQNEYLKFEGIVLLSVVISSIATTYVVRGPVEQGTFLVWAIFMGYLSCNFNEYKKGNNL